MEKVVLWVKASVRNESFPGHTCQAVSRFLLFSIKSTLITIFEKCLQTVEIGEKLIKMLVISAIYKIRSNWLQINK